MMNAMNVTICLHNLIIEGGDDELDRSEEKEQNERREAEEDFWRWAAQPWEPTNQPTTQPWEGEGGAILTLRKHNSHPASTNTTNQG